MLIYLQVGHALHLLHPTFKKYTFDERIKSIAKQLDFKRPAIPQSMFIYKNPKIGSEGWLIKSNLIGNSSAKKL